MFLTVTKKELDRVFSDPRLILSTLVFPGLLIFFLYWLIGENIMPAAASSITDLSELGPLLTSIGPVLIVTFLFNGCGTLTAESIAGEKERGTLASTLLTPMNRCQFILGKILGLSVLGIISAFSNSVGMIASFLFLGSPLASPLHFPVKWDFVLIFCGVVISLAFFMVSSLTVISCLSRSIKESTAVTTPFMLLFILIGFSAIQNNSASMFDYMIPVYNHVLCLRELFSNCYEPVPLFLTFVSNAIYTFFILSGIASLFHKENVILV